MWFSSENKCRTSEYLVRNINSCENFSSHAAPKLRHHQQMECNNYSEALTTQRTWIKGENFGCSSEIICKMLGIFSFFMKFDRQNLPCYRRKIKCCWLSCDHLVFSEVIVIVMFGKPFNLNIFYIFNFPVVNSLLFSFRLCCSQQKFLWPRPLGFLMHNLISLAPFQQARKWCKLV